MNINKQKILENICYTELVYERINKKLNIKFSKKQIEGFIFKTLKETDEIFFKNSGKNFYVTNVENNIRITINSNTYRIITVDKIEKYIKMNESQHTTKNIVHLADSINNEDDSNK